MADDYDDQDFGAILAAFEQEKPPEKRDEPKIGDKVQGTVAAFGDEVVFVDLGAKSEGLVAREELTDEDDRLTVAVGDRIEGMVSAVDETGSLVLRVRPGRGEAMRSELRMAWERQLPVEGLVTATVKGGVEVTVAGMRAFCPISQLADRYVEDASEFVDRRLDFRIQRFEEAGRRTNIVLSRRVLLEEEAERRADAVRERLEVGAVLDGTVTSVTSYGAFVDLGGLEGLLHVSEMSYERVADPRELISEGQRLEVQVLSVEPGKKPKQKERISLSIRVLQRDPWQDAAKRFPAGKVTEGRVMRLESFGAFVHLSPGLEGLVHVSRLGSDRHVRHAREVLELGQTVHVKVLSVEAPERRISLALEVDDGADEEAREYRDYREKSPGSEGFGSLGDFFKKSRGD